MKNLQINRRELQALCKKYNIKKLSLFGSAISKNFSDTSDVDLLVDFIPGCKPGYLTLSKIERELSGIFGGRKIDLRTPDELSRYFRDEVISSAHVQYAE